MSTDGRVGPRVADGTVLAVVGVTLIALVARLVGLGTRIMHWDEGRVGYWILRYHESGEFYYRPIIHGPFLPIVNDYVFTYLPATDFSARLVVAVVGGLFPLSALLLRDRLRNSETVALALFLAANPLLVYYSRFMRNDVLVAAFSFTALAFFVRAVDRGELKYLYPAAASLALGLTAKENGLIYLVCFVGAGALLFDHRLIRATRSGPGVRPLFRDYLVYVKTGLSSWAGDFRTGLFRIVAHTIGALVVFFAVIVFFYAPRPDFWQMFADPSMFPDVVSAGSVGVWERFASQWAAGHHQAHDYVPFLGGLLETLVYGAGILLVFAIIGFVVDGYSGGRSRDIVAFATYWGLASVVGYPIATDIEAPWAAVHVLVPLAIPAAVGGGYVYRTARQSIAIEDAVGTTIAALVILSAVVGTAGANVAYMDSSTQDTKQVLQWAQPNNDMKETLQKVKRVSEANEGTDVLYYGTCNPSNGCNQRDLGDALFYVSDENHPLNAPANWHSRLPLPWYMERYDVNQTSTKPEVSAAEATEDAPPVVIAYSWNRSELEAELPGYTVYEHDFKLWNEQIVFFIDESKLPDSESQADVSRSETNRSKVRRTPAVAG